MSTQTIESARQRYASFIKSAENIQNVTIAPGYGITYTQAGVNRSARIPEIEVNDADYMNTFQSLINGSGSSVLPSNMATTNNTDMGFKQVFGLGTVGDTIKDAATTTLNILDVIEGPVRYTPDPMAPTTTTNSNVSGQTWFQKYGVIMGVVAAVIAVVVWLFKRKRR